MSKYCTSGPKFREGGGGGHLPSLSDASCGPAHIKNILTSSLFLLFWDVKGNFLPTVFQDFQGPRPKFKDFPGPGFFTQFQEVV